VPGLYVCVRCWRFLFKAVGRATGDKQALYEQVSQRSEKFAALNAVVLPDFLREMQMQGREYCPWCFSQFVERVTDENHLALLTALAMEDGGNGGSSEDGESSDDGLIGCETD